MNTQNLLDTLFRFRKISFTKLLPDISMKDGHMLKVIQYTSTENAPKAITISYLAEVLQVSAPSISRSIKQLEERALVKRVIDAKDRRNTYVYLTDAGKAKVLEIDQFMHHFQQRVANRLGEEKISKLIHTLNELYEISQEEIANYQNNQPRQPSNKQLI